MAQQPTERVDRRRPRRCRLTARTRTPYISMAGPPQVEASRVPMAMLTRRTYDWPSKGHPWSEYHLQGRALPEVVPDPTGTGRVAAASRNLGAYVPALWGTCAPRKRHPRRVWSVRPPSLTRSPIDSPRRSPEVSPRVRSPGRATAHGGRYRLPAVLTRLSCRRGRPRVLRSAHGAKRPPGASFGNAAEGHAALVPRSASHELRRRLGLRRSQANGAAQPRGLLRELQLRLPVLPELEFSAVTTRAIRGDERGPARPGGESSHLLRLLLRRRPRDPDAPRLERGAPHGRAGHRRLLGDRGQLEPEAARRGRPAVAGDRRLHQVRSQGPQRSASRGSDGGIEPQDARELLPRGRAFPATPRPTTRRRQHVVGAGIRGLG